MGMNPDLGRTLNFPPTWSSGRQHRRHRNQGGHILPPRYQTGARPGAVQLLVNDMMADADPESQRARTQDEDLLVPGTGSLAGSSRSNPNTPVTLRYTSRTSTIDHHAAAGTTLGEE